MPKTNFSRPTLKALIERTKSDFNGLIADADAFLRRTFTSTYARIIAGLAHGLYGRLAWISEQVHPLTSAIEGLLLHGRTYLVVRKLPSKASGVVILEAADTAIMEKDTEIIRSDGVSFVSTGEVAAVGGFVAVPVLASNYGVGSNTPSGVQVKLVQPVVGIAASGVVGDGSLTGGSDEEGVEAYRARIVERIQKPPQGGAGLDYERWAKEVAGVTRVWVAKNEMGLGTVTVRFMMDDTYADGLPLVGDVARVQEYIDAENRRPVTAVFYAAAPVGIPLDIEITNLSPVTSEVKVAIEAELADMIRRIATPSGIIPLSKIWEAVSVATGEDSHLIASPLESIPHEIGRIAILGAVSYA